MGWRKRASVREREREGGSLYTGAPAVLHSNRHQALSRFDSKCFFLNFMGFQVYENAVRCNGRQECRVRLYEPAYGL